MQRPLSYTVKRFDLGDFVLALGPYFIRNTLATMKYGGKYGGPNQTSARNFVARCHEIPSGPIEFRGAATKLRVAVTNFVACCHEIPRARLVVLGGRLMILE